MKYLVHVLIKDVILVPYLLQYIIPLWLKMIVFSFVSRTYTHVSDSEFCVLFIKAMFSALLYMYICVLRNVMFVQ